MNHVIQTAHPSRPVLTAITILLLTLILAQSAAAAPQAPMEKRAQGQADVCRLDGGTANVHYEFSPVFEGAVTSIKTTCKGGKSNGWTCVNTADATSCTKPLTLAPDTPVQSTTPGDGAIAGTLDTSDPVPPRQTVVSGAVVLGQSAANQQEEDEP